jgi:hypothetical protein
MNALCVFFAPFALILALVAVAVVGRRREPRGHGRCTENRQA